jgi:circadian clock protein KaiB
MAAKYILKLYVIDQTANSIKAIGNLKDILKNGLNDVCELKVIDVLKNPQLAEEDKILATPALVKVLPPPVRKIIGDLSDKGKVLLGLGLTVKEEQLVDAV